MGALPIVHVLRVLPPWREVEHELTECGLSPSEHESISREEFYKRYRELGRERVAMLTCMTCLGAFERYGQIRRDAVVLKWEDDPVGSLAREAEKARWSRSKKRERLEAELRAIVQLVTEHRDEFDAILARMAWRAEHEEQKATKPKKAPPVPEGWV